mgnify:CR=1 FL=1
MNWVIKEVVLLFSYHDTNGGEIIIGTISVIFFMPNLERAFCQFPSLHFWMFVT